jgi:pimeloyl-ACP methyl ester carboxylesterase
MHKPGIILLHGALGCASQLKPLADVLAVSYDVHLYDFSGHGGKPINTAYSIELFAEELLQVRKKLDAADVAVFGYSMGGYVAMYAATLQQDAFNKITTLATKFDWNVESAKKEANMLQVASIEQKVPAYADVLKARFAPGDWKVALQHTADMMMRLGEHPLLTEHNIKKISIPVSLGIGDRDKMVSLQETLSVYKWLSNGSMFMLPDTPHPIEKVNVQLLGSILLSNM